MSYARQRDGAPRRAGRADRLAVLVLLLFAAAIRAAHLAELRSDPFIDRPIMDPEYHDLWARAIVAGRPFDQGVFFRAPLYPYFLAGIYRVSGAGPWAPRVVQSALSLASLFVLYRLARRLVGRRAALLALLLGVLYDLWPYFDGELLIKPLAIFLDLLAVDRFVAHLESRRPRDAVLAGLALGLSAIARPNVLSVVPGFALLLLSAPSGRRRAALFALATLPFPLLVTAANWVRGGDLVFIASQGGINFYLGNNRASNGWSAVAPGIRPDWWGGYQDMTRIPEKEAGRPLRPSEVSSYWTRRALAEIARDPWWWARHLARKAYLWFGAEELSNNKDLRFWTERFSVIDALPVRYAHLAPLAALGLLFVPWRRAAPLVLFVVPYAASFVLFFVTSRYRVVTVPFLAVLGGAALDGLATLARRGALAPLAARAALLAALTAFLSSGVARVEQPSFAISYAEIGRREMERGRWADAAAAFREALALDPRNLDARHDLGVALREGGDPTAGLPLLLEVARTRNDATAWNNAALAHWALGQRAEARDAFRRAIARDPRSAEAWLNSALLAEEEGDSAAVLGRAAEARAAYEEALAALEKGGSLRGEDPIVWYHRGFVLAALGRTAEARAAYERALALAPDLAEARARLEALPRVEPDSAPGGDGQPLGGAAAPGDDRPQQGGGTH